MASLQLHEDTKPLVCLGGIHRRQVGGRNENVHKPPGRKSNQDDSPWRHAFIWTRSTLAIPPARRGVIPDPVGNFGTLHAFPIASAPCATSALQQHYNSTTTALQQHSALAQCSTFAIILASFALIWAQLAALGETSETRHVLRCIAPARASATLVIVKLPASLPSERRSTGASLAWRQQAGLRQPFELVETRSGNRQTFMLACCHSPGR